MKKNLLWFISVTLTIILTTTFFAFLTLRNTCDKMRANLLDKGRLAAMSIDINKVSSLSGTVKDLENPDYLRLKDQFYKMKTSAHFFKFVYLLGINEKNEVFFFVDNEPENSTNISLPGEKYIDATNELKSIFLTGDSFVEGPLGDEWGTWVSPLVPLKNPETGKIIAVFGIDVEAGDWYWQLFRTTTPHILMALLILVLMTLIFFIQKSKNDISFSREQILKAKNAAENASKAKSEFLTNISHELKTPLNGIIGFNDLLLQTELDSSQKTYSENVKFSAESLHKTINDVLDYSFMETDGFELDLTFCNIIEVINDASDTVKPDALKKGLDLSVSVSSMPEKVLIDKDRLKQILLNLLNNAVKFTFFGKIELNAGFKETTTGKGMLIFSIKDTGIGIDDEKKKCLFNAFFQADSSSTRKFNGTGLGLSISRKIISKMNGEIKVESTAGKGSTFIFSIMADYKKGDS